LEDHLHFLPQRAHLLLVELSNVVALKYNLTAIGLE
jgi:hypothetical protein